MSTNHFKRLLAVVAIMFIPMCFYAQEKGNQIDNHWSNIAEVRFGDDFNHFRELGFLEVTVAPGYKFNNRFSLRIPVDLSVGLFNPTTTKNYDVLGTVGLNAAYNFVNNGKWRLEMNLSSGSTYMKSDWSYLYGDGTLRFGFAGLGPINPYIGLGVRYYHSYQMTMSDITTFCLTLGIWMF